MLGKRTLTKRGSSKRRFHHRIWRRYFFETLELRTLLTSVGTVIPVANTHGAPISTDVAVTFDQNIDGATATPQSFVVHSMQRGQLVGSAASVSTSGSTVAFNPTSDFFPGELVQVSVTSAIQNTTSEPADPRVWQLRTAASFGSGQFSNSEQSLGSDNGWSVELGDLDGDGDLDAFVANFNSANRVWLNNGSGQFNDSGQRLGNSSSRHVSLGDLDGDGDLDAFVANSYGRSYGNIFEGPNRVWLNNGRGQFSGSVQILGNQNSFGISLGDLDGDGDLDAFVANLGSPNRVWLNTGSGQFSDSGQTFGISRSMEVSLGDLDGDGDLDAYVANEGQGDRVWLNKGSGQFSDSEQSLGPDNGWSVELGDLDGDGDLDAFQAASFRNANQVFFNNGSGQFSNSGQRLGNHASDGVALGDLDGDGDLDAFVANGGGDGGRIWLNNGTGSFTDTAQSLGDRRSHAVSLGDLDSDGDLDALVANFDVGSSVWLNRNLPLAVPTVTLSVDRATIPENKVTGVATITATLSSDFFLPVTVDFGITGTATLTNDYTVSTTHIVIAPGATSGAITVTSVQDSLTSEGPETVIVDITVTNGIEAGTQQITVIIIDDDNPASLPFVTSVSPRAASHSAPISTDISATFDKNINGGTAAPQTFVVHSMQRGQLVGSAGAVSTTGAAITFDPDTDFFPGELVQATVTSGIQSTTGQPSEPQVWDFRTAVASGSGVFGDSGQSLGGHRTADVAVGDLDGDGDLDVITASGFRTPSGFRVWLNNGSGALSDSGQFFGEDRSGSITLGDVDADGDLDLVSTQASNFTYLWLNDGSGNFSDSGQRIGSHEDGSYDLAIGDLDADGDLDVFLASRNLEAVSSDEVWLNDGSGVFTDSGQRLGNDFSWHVALGDLDGDGDLDAWTSSLGGNVWLNDGSGNFIDSGQILETGAAHVLGDLDGDGDLDAIVVSWAGDPSRNRIWLNDGIGKFSDSGQILKIGNEESFDVSLGDLDGDGDLDAFVTNSYFQDPEPKGDRVWLNDGTGQFSESGQSLGDHRSRGLALGDMDGDGDLDALVSGSLEGGTRVWLNQNTRTMAVATNESAKSEGNSGNTQFSFTVTRSGDTSGASSVDYTVTGTGDNPADATDFGGTLPSGVVNFAANQPSQTITLNVTGDTVPEPDESFAITLSNPMPATQIFPDSVNVLIQNDDLPESASLVASQDNTLIETLDGSLSNGSGQHFFAGLTGGRSGPPLRRGLIGFDIADAGIPTGATIISATLTLNMSRTSTGSQDVSLHRLTSDWGQGTSNASGEGGSGGPSTTNDATWIHTFFNASTWATPGGDFHDVASATASVDTAGLYQWSGAGMVADVQEWLDNGGDFGWLVRGNEASNISTAKRFDSREHASAENRPVLEIEYALPVAGSSLSIASIDGTKPEGNTGNTPFTFMVARSGDTAGATSVNYAVTANGASPADAADFGGTLPSGVVNFAATEISKTITINVTGDSLVEADESFTVALSSPAPEGTQITTATASGTIQNDDHPLPSVTLQVDNATISETGGVATFTVTLSESTTVPVTVDLGISGTAAPRDYAASATQINVAAGATTGSVTVTAVDDALDEVDETVIVDIASVTNGTESGEQQQTITIIDDDEPLGLVVSLLTPTSSGFVAEFNADLDPGPLNLYDTQSAGLGAADVVLQGAASGPIAGSLIVNASLRMVTFIKTGDPLAPDVYSVTLRSAANGFKDANGVLLDGDGNGTAGGDFSETFTIAAPAANSVTVSFPDFVRGPGQGVNLPADTTAGISISISEGAGVRTAEIQIDYDPALLTITAAIVGPNMPDGATVVLDTSTAGKAVLTFTSPTDLPAGSNVLVNLQAIVPATDPNGIYGKQQVLDIHSATISDGNDNEFQVIADDALHLASYFADVSGNGRINASDAAQVARVAALLDSGFGATPLTDPSIVGDVSGNGRINAADASRVAQFAALIDVPEIPPIPGGIRITGGNTDLGPGLPGTPVLLLNQSPSSAAEYDSTDSSDGIAPLAIAAPVPHPPVDSVMSRWDDRSLEDQDEERSLAMESVVEELFAAL